MSWLARMEVDRDTAYTLKAFDNYAWHKKLWDCYPGSPDAARDFLTRIDQLEGAFRLWTLAQRKPVRPQWLHPDGFALREVAASFLSHRRYAFDLRANPTKCIVQHDETGVRKRHGNRRYIVKPDELRAWLVHKGNVRCRDKDTGLEIPGGFRIVEDKPLEISPMVESYFRKEGHKGFHSGVQFRGILEVTDREKFIETYHCGVGSAKGFGFGLLLLAPVSL